MCHPQEALNFFKAYSEIFYYTVEDFIYSSNFITNTYLQLFSSLLFKTHTQSFQVIRKR